MKLTNLKPLLALKGLTARQLSALIGRDPSEISRWSRGLVTPEPETVAKIATFLGVRVEDLSGPASASGNQQHISLAVENAELRAKIVIMDKDKQIDELKVKLAKQEDAVRLFLRDAARSSGDEAEAGAAMFALVDAFGIPRSEIARLGHPANQQPGGFTPKVIAGGTPSSHKNLYPDAQRNAEEAQRDPNHKPKAKTK